MMILAKKPRKRPDLGRMMCERCGADIERASSVQKYCRPCSDIRDRERKNIYALDKGRAKLSAEHAAWKERGAEISKSERLPLFKSLPSKPNLIWYHRIAVPFSWSGSKNHIFSNTASGHTFMRDEARYYRHAITERLRSNFNEQDLRINKLWIDIFVQKPSNRGDATNFLDLVCDAIKDAIPLDDRWYSVQSIDWQIVKHNPMIYVGIGQEDVPNVQACSTCGRLLEFHHFQRNRTAVNGVGRVCRECQSVTRANKRAKQLSELGEDNGQQGVFG